MTTSSGAIRPIGTADLLGQENLDAAPAAPAIILRHRNPPRDLGRFPLGSQTRESPRPGMEAPQGMIARGAIERLYDEIFRPWR
jgi:hypothetical protein